MGTYNKSIQYDIVIIGAGASGMLASIVAARQNVSVCLIDHSDRVGKKILATGNGKCNLGHVGISSEDYYGSVVNYASSLFDEFGTEDTKSFFDSIGLYIRERDNYLYPYSETAASVLDVLRFALINEGVTVCTETTIENISVTKGDYPFSVITNSGIYSAKKIILSTGGKTLKASGSDGSGYELAKKMGHALIPLAPALVKVKSNSNYCKMLDGVRAKGTITCKVMKNNRESIYSDKGEIQFTKDGLSGIPVFNISRNISYALQNNSRVSIDVNLIPDLNVEIITENITKRVHNMQNMTVEEAFTGIVNKKIMQAALKIADIKHDYPVKSLNKKIIFTVVSILQSLHFEITDVYGFENAQVTAGGISANEITSRLESLCCPGVYFAGEILDIDGKCGGYNLQWAWTSGYIAAKEAVNSIKG